ncbi:MAG: hypothetical protein Kow00128_14770 [Deltaproteobacteria bacterium]
MGISDKIQIEAEFGPLWSGVESIAVGDRIFTFVELKRALDLYGADVVGIDLHEMSGGHFAYRFYDGDDRCVVVFVMDARLNILRELRAHIAEWLEDEYYESGIEAFMASRMVRMLRRKVTGKEPAPGKTPE